MTPVVSRMGTESGCCHNGKQQSFGYIMPQVLFLWLALLGAYFRLLILDLSMDLEQRPILYFCFSGL